MLVKIDTYFDSEYWCARGVNKDIFTQGETYDELLKNIKEAVSLHFEDELKKGKAAMSRAGDCYIPIALQALPLLSNTPSPL